MGRKNHGPYLDPAPFAKWLANFELSDDELDRLGISSRRRYEWRKGTKVAEESVEHAGIVLVGDPRLSARLYPELEDL